MALWLTKTRRLWPDSLDGVLSRRMKERDAFSGAITWLLCGAIVGIPLMLVTTAVTTENTMNLTQIDSVPPNTVRVTMADRLGKPMEIPETLQAQVDAEFPQQPIRIRQVAEEQSVLPQTTVQVGFDAFRMGQLWVFESVSDIDRWLGGLSPEQKATLNNGGILGVDARDGAIPVHVSSLDGTTRTETVTAAPFELLHQLTQEGSTVLCVTHDPLAIQYSDQVFSMDAGVLSPISHHDISQTYDFLR